MVDIFHYPFPLYRLFFCPANRVWGQEHKRAVYTALLTSGKLNSYLADIDQQTQDMFLQLVEQMAEREGVTEKLKAEDQMRWVGLMNNIAERAREIVNAEIIYSGTSAINVPTHTEYKDSVSRWKFKSSCSKMDSFRIVARMGIMPSLPQPHSSCGFEAFLPQSTKVVKRNCADLLSLVP